MIKNTGRCTQGHTVRPRVRLPLRPSSLLHGGPDSSPYIGRRPPQRDPGLVISTQKLFKENHQGTFVTLDYPCYNRRFLPLKRSGKRPAYAE
jgi:hypothetical protein